MPIRYKRVPLFPLYRVGTDGSVWRLMDKKTWVKLRGSTIGSKSPHKAVTLYNHVGRVTKYVHRLVLEAFVGPCPPGMEGIHYPDQDYRNNELSNLQWGTRALNVKHREEIGKNNTGSANGNAKLTEEDVVFCLRAFARGVSVTALSRFFDVSRWSIGEVKRRQAWKHVKVPE